MHRCLIATLGKDAPGVNAAVRAATRLASRRKFQVVGARRGFPGILDEDYRSLRAADVAFLLGKGGSYLGSVDFRLPLPSPAAQETVSRLADALKKFDIVVATGGLGSFSILSRVYATNDMGMTTTMFIPASIENEFLNPAKETKGENGIHAESIGADTAANTALEAIDKLREQSYLTRTVFMIQCVGMKSNFLPIQIGTACGAHRVYLPPFPLLADGDKAELARLFGPAFDPNRVDMNELVGWIERMFRDSRKTYLNVILPSGIPLGHMTSEQGPGQPERYESIVTSMAPIELTTLRVVDGLMMHFADSEQVHVCYVVLDDLQRGGSPTFRDRMLGSIYGEAAIEEYLNIINTQDIDKRGNLNLLAVSDTLRFSWQCYSRALVLPLFSGPNPRVGGLDPMPFFRQSRGTVSGYRPLAVF